MTIYFLILLYADPTIVLFKYKATLDANTKKKKFNTIDVFAHIIDTSAKMNVIKKNSLKSIDK